MPIPPAAAFRPPADALPPPLPARASLFLDFDGTLVELAATPEDVRIPPALVGILDAMHRACDGALAIVTGRALDSIDAMLAPLQLPAAGAHGASLRLRAGGPVQSAPSLPGVAARLRERLGDGEGLRIEDKGAAVAVHYRAAPQRAAEAEAALREAVDGLPVRIMSGKQVFEAHLETHSKGTAVHAFMRQAPFTGRMPVYIGDDVTDEDGMEAALALGGFAVRVSGGESCAPYRLRDPQAVRDWLAAALRAG